MDNQEAILLLKRKLSECNILLNALLNIKKNQENCCVYDNRLKVMYENLTERKKMFRSFLKSIKKLG